MINGTDSELLMYTAKVALRDPCLCRYESMDMQVSYQAQLLTILMRPVIADLNLTNQFASNRNTCIRNREPELTKHPHLITFTDSKKKYC